MFKPNFEFSVRDSHTVVVKDLSGIERAKEYGDYQIRFGTFVSSTDEDIQVYIVHPRSYSLNIKRVSFQDGSSFELEECDQQEYSRVVDDIKRNLYCRRHHTRIRPMIKFILTT